MINQYAQNIYLACFFLFTPLLGLSSNISITNSISGLANRGSGTSDIQVIATATTQPLQFGDEAVITLQATNLGPESQSAVGIFSTDFILGLAFPTSATCNIEIILQRQDERGFSDFGLLWIVDDLLPSDTRECVITLPVSSSEPGSETTTFTHTETASDPNPANDASSFTLNFLGIGGVPVPAISTLGLGLMIILIFSMVLPLSTKLKTQSIND